MNCPAATASSYPSVWYFRLWPGRCGVTLSKKSSTASSSPGLVLCLGTTAIDGSSSSSSSSVITMISGHDVSGSRGTAIWGALSRLTRSTAAGRDRNGSDPGGTSQAITITATLSEAPASFAASINRFTIPSDELLLCRISSTRPSSSTSVSPSEHSRYRSPGAISADRTETRTASAMPSARVITLRGSRTACALGMSGFISSTSLISVWSCVSCSSLPSRNR
jgi:hypothetical protein